MHRVLCWLFYPPSQKATGVNPWMNARWVPSVALAKEGALRPSPSEVGYGRRRPEGSALRGVWRGATAVRPWGSTPTSFCIQSAEVRPLFRSNHVLCVAHPRWRPATQTIKLSGANPHVRVVPPFVLDRGFETHGLGLPMDCNYGRES